MKQVHFLIQNEILRERYAKGTMQSSSLKLKARNYNKIYQILTIMSTANILSIHSPLTKIHTYNVLDTVFSFFSRKHHVMRAKQDKAAVRTP